MIRVRKSVMEETANKQVPWEEAALNESFYFVSPTIAGPHRVRRRRSSLRGEIRASAAGPRQPPARNGGSSPPARSNLPPNVGGGAGLGL